VRVRLSFKEQKRVRERMGRERGGERGKESVRRRGRELNN